MRKIVYILFLLMTFVSVAQAQKKIIYQDTSLLQKDEPIAAPVEDSGVAAVIDTGLYENDLRLSSDSIKSWRNLKEYGYTQYLDSLLRSQKKKEAKPENLQRSYGSGILSSIFSSGFVQVFFWTLAICFIGFVIYKLFLTEGVFKRKSAASNAGAEVEEEVITNESDFDALIRLALQNANYRQAVRYQYLRTLHTLAGKNFLILAPDKTNFQYVSEISNRSYQNDFASLTLSYEYVWYGEFNIEQGLYQKIETSFINFNQKL